MSKLIIHGGQPLHGQITLGGAKNASFKIMIAALLVDGPVILHNLPDISDVTLTAQVIRSLGGQAELIAPNSYLIDGRSLHCAHLDQKFGQASRLSTIFLPVLLGKFARASVPFPGGDQIGQRPLERHFAGLQALGAQIELQSKQISATLPAQTFTGADFTFFKNSHTGTETLLLAAVQADSSSTITSAAQEPEVHDLINFLNQAGANITQTAPRTYYIQPIPHLTPPPDFSYTIMGDRNEAVSYACAAIATRGDVLVRGANPDHLSAFLNKLVQIGAPAQISPAGIRFYYQGPLQPTDLTTGIHPGFMTDWQPLWATLIAHAHGVSTIHETIMSNRFQYLPALVTMGAKMSLFRPQVSNPAQFYNFNLDEPAADMPHGLEIHGPTQFHGGKFAVTDLRQGATLILAALTADSPTTLSNLEQIDRGYQKLDTQLVNLGAKIERI